MSYSKQVWKDLPDKSTPLSAARLNHLETQYDQSARYTDAKVSGVPSFDYVDTAVAAAGAGYYPPVEGCSLYSYGHSYTIQPGPYSTPNGGEYQLRLGKRLGMGPVFSRGRSGTPAPDTFGLALSKSFNDAPAVPRDWTPGSRGVVLLQNYMNEASGNQGSDPKFRDMWKRSMRSVMALVSAGKMLTASEGTRRGTWTKYANVDSVSIWANEDIYFATQTTAEIDFTVTGDEVWVVVAATAASYPVADLEVRCGGKVVATHATSGVNPEYTSVVRPGRATNQYPGAYKVTGLNAAAGTTGNKTITIKPRTNGTFFINAVLIPSVAKPAIFVAKEPPRSPGATTGSAAFAQNDPAFRAMVDELVGEFENAYAVDLAPGWDNSKFVGSLDVNHKFHPNDLGMQHIASSFEEGIRSHIRSPVNGVMVL